MKTIHDNKEYFTYLDPSDKQVLMDVVRNSQNAISLAEAGLYKQLTDAQIWINLVGQVCVMGSSRPWEKLTQTKELWDKFEEAISLERLFKEYSRAEYLSAQLKTFSATRFHNRAGARLSNVLSCEEVFRDQRLVLFGGLFEDLMAVDIRDELMRRNPLFKLKSTSDFMIQLGISNDVIALDTRLVGFFRKHLNCDLSYGRVQANPKIYLSVEQALRVFCEEQRISLALLDRALFRSAAAGRSLSAILKKSGLNSEAKQMEGDTASDAAPQEESSQPEFMRIDETENAIDYLEKAAQSAMEKDDPLRWKWIVLGLHQSLYGFLVLALGGNTNYELVLNPPRKDKKKKGSVPSKRRKQIPPAERKLIDFRTALVRACQKEYMSRFVRSCPLTITMQQRESLSKLRAEFRNRFIHYIPTLWSIEIEAFREVFRDTLDIIETLVFETETVSTILFDRNRQYRVKTAIAVIRSSI